MIFEIIDNWDYIKLKRVCTIKEVQSTEWRDKLQNGRISAILLTDELISRMYKELKNT
jgi:hypothetical protein